MSAKENGGPAFPRTYSTRGDGKDTAYLCDSTAFIETTGGMTLRDYFAAKAMQGICCNRSSINKASAYKTLAFSADN